MLVRGNGPPLVLIPGIQGRWQWMRPAVRALAERFRVITFSLAAGRALDMEGGSGLAFDQQLDQVTSAMARAGAERAIVCGVSYGGLVAVRLAAARPARVAGLVLASTPGPAWRPDDRARRYVGSPWWSMPAFALGARDRLWREIGVARPGRLDRWLTLGGYLGEIASHPPSPAAMAWRVRACEGCDFGRDARAVSAPTLVITGEPGLDRVVPVAGTREYLALIRGSVGLTLEGTGHIGLVTRPREFAAAIARFAATIETT
jgi:3-oxoadipate enol-lactonase